ncbi:hypothetical protein [Demequina mangrovi]|uniref:DUF7847 domain-containing protein n=1 Tax=Demequina mangrovi TaxID=1043493 RepID=A0A1H6WVL8_9MICO|nr:hypothetical protein [Demequina mangrovi]SEJ20931.1 hypothetical protein SAMN05421637_1160 [Demequina mangrovi]
MNDGEDRTEWAAPGGITPDSGPSAANVPPSPAAPPQTAPPAMAVPPMAPPHGAVPAPAPVPTSASWQPGFMPLRPLGFGDLLGLPFRAMRDNRAVVVGGPVLLTLGATALLVAALWMLFNDVSLVFSDLTTTDSLSAGTVALIVAFVVAALLADVLSSAIIAPGVARGILGERIRIADAWRAVRPRLGSLLLLYLLAGLANLVAIAIGVLLVVIATANGNDFGTVVSVIVAGVVAAAVIFLVALIGGLARPVIVLERRGAVAALRRTLRLLRRRFWWTFLVGFVAWLLVGLVANVVSQVGSLVAMAIAFAAPESTILTTVVFVVAMLISLLVGFVLMYSYMGALFTLILVDLRIRHEGFDLALAEAAEARRA